MKTKGMGIALLSAAALLGTATAQAELPWTYAEFGYAAADGEDNFETDAYDLKGSIGFAEVWHASLAYRDGTSEQGEFNEDVDFDGYQLIFGAHPQLTPNTQLITDFTYFDYDFDGGEGSSGGTDGLGVGFGLRHAITDKAEVFTEAWYVMGDTDGSFFSSDSTDYNDTTVEIGGRYNWMPQLSTGVTVALNGGPGGASYFVFGDSIRFDVRWSFGDVL
jgi:hypothetical protein